MVFVFGCFLSSGVLIFIGTLIPFSYLSFVFGCIFSGVLILFGILDGFLFFSGFCSLVSLSSGVDFMGVFNGPFFFSFLFSFLEF